MVEQSSGGSAIGVAQGQKAQLSSGVIASLTGVGLLIIFMVQKALLRWREWDRLAAVEARF